MSQTDAPLGALLDTVPPVLSEAEALALAETHFGLTGRLDRLTSERDLNWRLTSADGRRHVVKIANPAEPHDVTRFQNAALLHIAARDPDLPVPRVIPARNGATDVLLPSGSLLRVLSYVEGMPMHLAPPSPVLRASIGHMAARLTRALEGFAHPAAGHELQWDIKQAARLRPLLPAISDEVIRASCTRWLDLFDARTKPALRDVPWQVVHADLNPHNVLVKDEDHACVSGILDFGDMVHTPRICDLAVAASYQIDPVSPMDSLAEMASAWDAVLPLLPGELAILFDLVAIRMVTTLAITSFRAARYPENAAYILRNFASARSGLEAIDQIDRIAARAALARACGKE